MRLLALLVRIVLRFFSAGGSLPMTASFFGGRPLRIPLEITHCVRERSSSFHRLPAVSFGMTPSNFLGGIRRGLRPRLIPLTTNAMSFRSAYLGGEESPR